MTQTMTFHEAASLLPMMTEAELSELAEDIRAHRQREPIYTFQGKILDGRNRYLACGKAGIKPAFREWDGKGSLVAFIISENIKRRHLNAAQKAVIGAEAEPLFAAEAKKRQATSTGGRTPQLVANSPQADKRKSRDKAAAVVGVGGRAISEVKAIKTADPSLIPLMRDGKLNMQEGKLAAMLPAADRGRPELAQKYARLAENISQEVST
jgi:hypothetical protein